MREILFRGKRKDNGEWVEGCLLIDYVSGQYFIHASGNSVNESDKVNEEGCLLLVAFEVDPETVCQYTGLTDKNGRKIFEGDICTIYDTSYDAKLTCIIRIGRYEHDDGGEYDPTPIIGIYVEIFKWEYSENSHFIGEEYPELNRTLSITEAMDEHAFVEFKNFEVVNNIFENPELLQN